MLGVRRAKSVKRRDGETEHMHTPVRPERRADKERDQDVRGAGASEIIKRRRYLVNTSPSRNSVRQHKSMCKERWLTASTNSSVFMPYASDPC